MTDQVSGEFHIEICRCNTSMCKSAAGLAASITVASLALADAGIHMYDVAVGCSVVMHAYFYALQRVTVFSFNVCLF